MNSIVNIVFYFTSTDFIMEVWRHKISYCSLAKSSLSLSSYGDGVSFTWSNLHRSHCQSGQLLWSVNKDRIVWVCLAVNLGFDANLEQRGLAPCSQEGKGVRKKIRSPEFLLFPSYHKTTQWNGLWKTYGGFGRDTVERGLGMKQNFVYRMSISCCDSCIQTS